MFEDKDNISIINDNHLGDILVNNQQKYTSVPPVVAPSDDNFSAINGASKNDVQMSDLHSVSSYSGGDELCGKKRKVAH